MAKEKKLKPFKHPLLFPFAKFFFGLWARVVLGYRKKSKFRIQKGERILVLSNHQTDLDPVLIRLSFNRFLYTVATDNIFSNPKTVKWLTRLGAIPKRKGLVDIKSTIAMSNIAQQGGSMLLFPEGNRCYAEFQFFISENFAKLLKSLKCTIVLFNLHGGFGSMPRFGSKKRRKGPFYGRIKKVLKYKNYENLTVEESEYPFFEVDKAKINNLKMKGKYSFQYCSNIEITNSNLDTKDAFWHSKNVTVRDSVIKGEYLGWYSENLTLINCHIVGTQPLCYCKNLVLEYAAVQDVNCIFFRGFLNKRLPLFKCLKLIAVQPVRECIVLQKFLIPCLTLSIPPLSAYFVLIYSHSSLADLCHLIQKSRDLGIFCFEVTILFLGHAAFREKQDRMRLRNLMQPVCFLSV